MRPARRKLVWRNAKRNAYISFGFDDPHDLYATVVFLPTKHSWTFTLTRFIDEYHEFDTHAEAVNFIEALWALEDCDESDE